MLLSQVGGQAAGRGTTTREEGRGLVKDATAAAQAALSPGVPPGGRSRRKSSYARCSC